MGESSILPVLLAGSKLFIINILLHQVDLRVNLSDQVLFVLLLPLLFLEFHLQLLGLLDLEVFLYNLHAFFKFVLPLFL